MVLAIEHRVPDILNVQAMAIRMEPTVKDEWNVFSMGMPESNR